MNENSFVRKSLVTHLEYDYFKCIKILNFSQAEFYIENGVELKDIIFQDDRRNGKKMLVFYFYKDETKEIYDKWCKMSNKNN